MFSVGWHTIVQSCDDNHKEVTPNQKKQYSQHHPRVDNDDEYARTTDLDMRSHVSVGNFTRSIEDCRFIKQRVAVRYVKSITNAHIYLVIRGRLLLFRSTG